MPSITPQHRAQLRTAVLENCRRDFFYFCSRLTIPAANGVAKFGEVMQPFQRECFEALSPSLYALRDNETPPIRRFWWERTKGASKDMDIAISLVWLLTFASWPIYCQAGAADREQAGIVKRRIESLLHENRWLKQYLRCVGWSVKNDETGATLDVLASDISGGAHGETPNVLVINELSHVQRWGFIQDLVDNADKVPNGIRIAATNAGFIGTEPHRWKKIAEESAATDGRWFVSVFDRPAPWIREDDLAEARKRDKGTRYNRLWRGKWSSGKGDALFAETIAACVDPDATIPGVSWRSDDDWKPAAQWQFLGGLDLGTHQDHSGLVVIGVSCAGRKIRLAAAHSWKPERKNPQTGRLEVDLKQVKDAVIAAHKTFGIDWFGYDPSQAVFMAQELQDEGVPMIEVPFTPKNCTDMATSLVQVFEHRIIELYPDDHLLNDLGKLVIEERGEKQYKLTAMRDSEGHADVATALVIALPEASLRLGWGEGGFDLMMPDEADLATIHEPLSDADMEELPDYLREIVEDSRVHRGDVRRGNLRNDW